MNFLILTESAGNPRSFPSSEVTQLEETYPYLIRAEYKESTFWQLSFGNITTEQLCAQVISYLNHWGPDVVIVHSGLNDCRPEAFTEFQKTILNKLSGRLFRHLKKFVFHPNLIRRRQVQRVSKRSFRKTLKRFQLTFSESKILWLEICAETGYEELRPGVTRRMFEYNQIIKEIYNNNFVEISERMLEIRGFNSDKLHWNKRGHLAVAQIILDRIKLHLEK